MGSSPTEVNTDGHAGQHNEHEDSAETPIPDLTDRASYSARLRLILILAILTWVSLGFAIAGIIRKL
jgi:hypothetical protein